MRLCRAPKTLTQNGIGCKEGAEGASQRWAATFALREVGRKQPPKEVASSLTWHLRLASNSPPPAALFAAGGRQA